MALVISGFPSLDLYATAEALDVSPTTVRRAVYAGELASYRIGGRLRFRPDDVADYVQSRRQPAGVPA